MLGAVSTVLEYPNLLLHKSKTISIPPLGEKSWELNAFTSPSAAFQGASFYRTHLCDGQNSKPLAYSVCPLKKPPIVLPWGRGQTAQLPESHLSSAFEHQSGVVLFSVPCSKTEPAWFYGHALSMKHRWDLLDFSYSDHEKVALESLCRTLGRGQLHSRPSPQGYIFL